MRYDLPYHIFINTVTYLPTGGAVTQATLSPTLVRESDIKASVYMNTSHILLHSLYLITNVLRHMIGIMLIAIIGTDTHKSQLILL